MIKYFLLLVLILSGCLHTSSSLSTDSILASEWAQWPTFYKPKPLFCYKSLGKPECYEEPLENSSDRLIASYDNSFSSYNNFSLKDSSQKEIKVEKINTLK